MWKEKEGSEISTTSRFWEKYFKETRCPNSLLEQEKGKVCFGSGLERKLMECDTRGMVSKHARSNMRPIQENIGPGSYDISKQTSALSRLMNKPVSKLGTVLGGRRAEREGAFGSDALGPGPGDYEIPSTFPKHFKEACAPFNGWAERLKFKTSNVPGVGVYNVAPYKPKRAAFAHSFGGKSCLLPAVKMKCGPFNFDTCERCEKFPEGDYWYLDSTEVQYKSKVKKPKDAPPGVFLCRPCYEIEKQENAIFNKMQMRTFKKIRDCSKVHFHDECKAKLFLVSPQEIEKVKEREGYLALYFS